MIRFHISATYATPSGRRGTFSAIRIAANGSAALLWAQRHIRANRAVAGKLDVRATPMSEA